MDKNNYYVSVQAGTVMNRQSDAAYELEIVATPEEAEHLRRLFDRNMDADKSAQLRAIIPGIPYHLDKENHAVDAVLQEIYQYIYDLGTGETKRHIDTMGILRPAQETNH